MILLLAIRNLITKGEVTKWRIIFAKPDGCFAEIQVFEDDLTHKLKI